MFVLAVPQDGVCYSNRQSLFETFVKSNNMASLQESDFFFFQCSDIAGV